jgi:hypothetical protein
MTYFIFCDLCFPVFLFKIYPIGIVRTYERPRCIQVRAEVFFGTAREVDRNCSRLLTYPANLSRVRTSAFYVTATDQPRDAGRKSHHPPSLSGVVTLLTEYDLRHPLPSALQSAAHRSSLNSNLSSAAFVRRAGVRKKLRYYDFA